MKPRAPSPRWNGHDEYKSITADDPWKELSIMGKLLLLVLLTTHAFSCGFYSLVATEPICTYRPPPAPQPDHDHDHDAMMRFVGFPRWQPDENAHAVLADHNTYDHLPPSPSISLHLLPSPSISLPVSPCISLHLLSSPIVPLCACRFETDSPRSAHAWAYMTAGFIFAHFFAAHAGLLLLFASSHGVFTPGATLYSADCEAMDDNAAGRSVTFEKVVDVRLLTLI